MKRKLKKDKKRIIKEFSKVGKELNPKVEDGCTLVDKVLEKYGEDALIKE